MIVSLRISNYKSIRDINLKNIPNLAVFIGANAAGKSNFVDALDFLSLVFSRGLASAIRTKGGYENICFRRVKRAKGGLKFFLQAREKDTRNRPKKEQDGEYIITYSFAFRAKKESILAEYEISNEEINVEVQSNPLVRESLLHVNRIKNKVVEVDIPDGKETQSNIRGESAFLKMYLNDYVKNHALHADELLVAPTFTHLPYLSNLRNLLSGFRLFQISPHIARETGIPERSPELGRHGENLPAAVDYLKRQEPEAFRELVDHLNYTVPTMDKIETAYVETKALGLFFSEKGVGRRWFSQDVSDGTICTISIFLPLVDPRIRIMALEEPENSLHPWILRHFVQSCKNHSREKQIFLTTQSLVAVNEVPLESLYIVRRYRGATSIARCVDLYPEAEQVIKEQLLGLGEYWDSGAITGVPEYGDQLPLFANEKG